MKLIHLSDLHLGKRMNEFNLLEDQDYILREIVGIVGREAPDAVLIAGDVYDKSVPSAEAVRLFDDFLCRLAGRGGRVFVISGNHDSPERLAFGGRLMGDSGVRLAPVYDGAVKPDILEDAHGPVHIYMLPFVKPAHVRRFFPETPIESYTDALRVAIENMGVDPAARNVLVAHQFVTGGTRSDSEDISVGGTDNVDAEVFAPFDYVALGHLHRPQNVGRDTLRYCGTPLKYAFSEAGQQKSVTVAELGEKGSVRVRAVPLVPRRELRELRGTYMELTAKTAYDGTDTEDYLHITLTDEEDVPDAVGKLRAIYPNLARLDYDNSRTRACFAPDAGAAEGASPLELFAAFYRQQNGRPMSEEQRAFAGALMEEIWEEGL